MPSKWDEDQHGVVIKVVVGWETALLAQAGCLLRINFLHRTEKLDAPPKPDAVQLGMTAKQARELATDLIHMADRAVHVPPDVKLS
jgi:hypothetical protein